MTNANLIHAMKSFYSLLLVVFILGCGDQTSDSLIVIHEVAIIDAVQGFKSDQSVVIRNEEIIEVVNASEVMIPNGAEVIDGKGKFLIPGLWDAHVHLSYIPELSSSMFDLFLVNGITSIRDTGGQLDLVMPWKEKSVANPGSSPRVMVAGPLLDGVPTVYDGSPGRPKLGLGAATPEEAKLLVDQFVEAGVDLIKSYEMLTPQSYQAVIEHAKRYDLPVTGHVPLSMDVIEASDLGLRSMEHLRNLEMACSSDFDSLKKVREKLLIEGNSLQGGVLRSNIHEAQRYHAVFTQDAQRRDLVLTTLLKNNTWQVPTLTIAAARQNRVFDREEWRDDFRYLPPSVRDQWTESAINFSEIATPEKSIAYANWAYEMIGHLDDKRIGIMAGTDTPIFFLTPGFSLHEELRLLVKGGLSPLKALEAATIRPAEYFNLQEKLGTIEAGKLADLVLLNANPLKEITNTQKITAVIKNGMFYSRNSLDSMLENLENPTP